MISVLSPFPYIFFPSNLIGSASEQNCAQRRPVGYFLLVPRYSCQPSEQRLIHVPKEQEVTLILGIVQKQK